MTVANKRVAGLLLVLTSAFAITLAITRRLNDARLIPFEILMSGEINSGLVSEGTAALVVIPQFDDVEIVAKGRLLDDLAVVERLRQINYNDHFAILVVYGQYPVGGYQVGIQQINWQNGQILVKAMAIVHTPLPEIMVLPALASPYHLISVEKKGVRDSQFHFVLLVNDVPVAETFNSIP